jgi:osmotically inducible protein OsmC
MTTVIATWYGAVFDDDRHSRQRGPAKGAGVSTTTQGNLEGQRALVTAAHKEPGVMPAELKEVLYTAEALVEGGREGHGRTSDGRLEVDFSVPASMSGSDGPGTNPEQLFALGYAACFQSALLGVAQGRNLDASGSQITSQVGIGPRGSGGFGLQVSLDLHAPNVTAEDARELMLRADRLCPYSNATRGNIIVALSVDGQPVEKVV